MVYPYCKGSIFSLEKSFAIFSGILEQTKCYCCLLLSMISLYGLKGLLYKQIVYYIVMTVVQSEIGAVFYFFDNVTVATLCQVLPSLTAVEHNHVPG